MNRDRMLWSKGKIFKSLKTVLFLMILGLCSSACQSAVETEMWTDGERLRVVATTNIVGDVVKQVGGNKIDLVVLMDPGVDPHSYMPTPLDSVAIHDADIVFSNGFQLEANLENILENAGGQAVHVEVSEGIEAIALDADHHEEEEGDAHAAEEEEDEDHHEHGALDPHVWFDVQNVIHWVGNIEENLSTLDPQHSEEYAANAKAYLVELEKLDGWVSDELAKIPPENRKLVSSHPVFGYLIARYDMEQVGAVYPINPAGEPSAQDIALLQDAISEYGVPAVFGESTVNPKLAEQVAADTGVHLVGLYTGSLGKPGSGVESYVDLIRFDITAIAEALTPAE